MELYNQHLQYERDYLGRRKGRKLLAEKRRRNRINQCLDEIKDIVCASQKQNDPNYDKLEKAEILETTVDYLRNVRKIKLVQQEVKETIQARFNDGFTKCAEKILSYIQQLPGVTETVDIQLRSILQRRVKAVQRVTSSKVSSSEQIRTSYGEEFVNRNSQYSAHAHIITSAWPTHVPGYQDNSLSDSGYFGSPNAENNTRTVESVFRSQVDLSKRSRSVSKTFDDSRVRAWLDSTWAYSQQITAEQKAPWRPW